MISPRRREEIIDALRRGTVPQNSLDAFAVGLDRFEPALKEELEKVASSGGVFKAVRGEYGCGKTFFSRWLQIRHENRDLPRRKSKYRKRRRPCIAWKQSTAG